MGLWGVGCGALAHLNMLLTETLAKLLHEKLSGMSARVHGCRMGCLLD